ncbi:hypothetical protein JQS43_18130 [Natronosporangium hydrolyticum]|uniref:Uncharacterized protein n=1 Tax=Natronosporangium hydrolyticum TaxID=2811111 RepID=A0A895YDN4_9ACTN|nr:hypothetical protein [Natronosporangium hydrolyticum]QSB13499.1 hypothetical protein JQS43_18130 [Natronosporangium hydrolyticum]
MTLVVRAQRALIGLVLVALLAGGCWGGDEGQSIEFASVDGEKWPLRGSLAEDAELRAEVAEVVAGWRTPEGSGADERSTVVFWLGEVDGVVLGMVNFQAAEDGGRWSLEVTGQPGELTVSDARSHPFGVYTTDVLSVRSPAVGPRYLTSAKIATLTVRGEVAPVDSEGLTAVMAVPECRLSSLASSGETFEHYQLDLGLGISEPFYPLIRGREQSAELLADVDMCAELTADGWLASGESESSPAGLRGEHPDVSELAASAAVVSGPEGLPGSLAEVQAHYADTLGQVRMASWLVWTYPDEVTEVMAPIGAEVITDEPGLFVMRKPRPQEEPIDFSFREGDQEHDVSVIPPGG